MTLTDPLTGKPRQFMMPAGGRGYTRPATLVSLWSTAPFLQNNSLGRFEAQPSVEARLKSFDDSIRKLLWPEKREMDSKFGAAVGGLIDRLPDPAYLMVPYGHLPGFLKPWVGPLAWAVPAVFTNGSARLDFKGSTTQGNASITNVSAADPLTTFNAGAPVSGPGIPDGSRIVVFDAAAKTLRIDRPAAATTQDVVLATDAPDAGLKVGPIPAGTPINLLSGVELAPETGGIIKTMLHDLKLVGKLAGLPFTLRRIANESDTGKRESITTEMESTLLSEDKCPDFVVNRGHYFGTDKLGEEPGLSDSDKEALIAFLKTF